jgi:hypothetical protein
VLLGAALLALGTFYVLGAAEHARVINTARARADQSGYLWDAVAIHRNWQGTQDELIGERNRMPMYPGFLALFYDPAMTPDDFFERGKQLNIRLSLVLLLVIGLVAHWRLPTAWASAFTLVVAFGYFIFKAGYAQSELLFYTLLFLAFLSQLHLLRGGTQRRDAAVAALGGVVAAVAHLTKAAALPLVGLFAGVYAVTEIGFFFSAPTGATDRLSPSRTVRALRRGGLLALFLGAFLLTLYPYIANSHRVFGHYFYNVNTTFYLWYDDWPAASIGTYQHGDGVGWPDLPPDQLPSMARYWREHSLSQITARLLDGLRDMVVVTYQRFWIAKYLVVYLGIALALGLSARRALRDLVLSHVPLATFLVAYAGAYLVAIAFYKPISGTTTRMFLAHVAPLLFTLSAFAARAPFRDCQWRVGEVTLKAAHLPLIISGLMLTDIAFMLWPRLMADFTGY